MSNTKVSNSVTLDPDLFLPDPEPRQVHYTIISVDDHLVEPAHTFEGRLRKSNLYTPWDF